MQVSVTEFRHHLFQYLNQLSDGVLELTSKGKVVARVSAPEDPQVAAKQCLLALRKTARIVGDLDLSSELHWNEGSDDFTGH